MLCSVFPLKTPITLLLFPPPDLPFSVLWLPPQPDPHHDSSPDCHYLRDPWMHWQNVWLVIHTSPWHSFPGKLAWPDRAPWFHSTRETALLSPELQRASEQCNVAVISAERGKRKMYSCIFIHLPQLYTEGLGDVLDSSTSLLSGCAIPHCADKEKKAGAMMSFCLSFCSVWLQGYF